jgi:hypothetical protein
MLKEWQRGDSIRLSIQSLAWSSLVNLPTKQLFPSGSIPVTSKPSPSGSMLNSSNPTSGDFMVHCVMNRALSHGRV